MTSKWVCRFFSRLTLEEKKLWLFWSFFRCYSCVGFYDDVSICVHLPDFHHYHWLSLLFLKSISMPHSIVSNIICVLNCYRCELKPSCKLCWISFEHATICNIAIYYFFSLLKIHSEWFLLRKLYVNSLEVLKSPWKSIYILYILYFLFVELDFKPNSLCMNVNCIGVGIIEE